MFEVLFNPKKAERKPLEMLFVGFFYSSISLLFSVFIFPQYASLIMIFLTTLSCIYVIQGAIKKEEEKELSYKKESWILEQHFRIVKIFLALFIGFVIAFSFWTFVLPLEKVIIVFKIQNTVVEGIKNLSLTGSSTFQKSFFIILENNLKVLLISLIFALLYGAGAIFVLVWNASVMGFVIGILARNTFGLLALPIAFLKYFLHGIPEMLSYFIIALAGGVLYVSISKKDFLNKEKFKTILRDVLVLSLLAIFLLIIAAFLEVYVSSLI